MNIDYRKPEYQEIAKAMMKEIMYDSGAVNSKEKEKYPLNHLDSIACYAGLFFHYNPSLLNDENINLICTGEQDEVEEKFKKCKGYSLMMQSLNAYFDKL